MTLTAALILTDDGTLAAVHETGDRLRVRRFSDYDHCKPEISRLSGRFWPLHHVFLDEYLEALYLVAKYASFSRAGTNTAADLPIAVI